MPMRVRGVAAGEFERVVDEVDVEPRHQRRIGGTGRHRAELDGDVAVCPSGVTVVDDAADDRRGIDPALLQRLARQAREGEQIVHQPAHADAVAADDAQEPRRLRLERVGEILDQRPGKTVDGAQRRAQIVRHRIGEGIELGLGGAHLLHRLVEPCLGLGRRRYRRGVAHGSISQARVIFAASSDGS